MNTDSCSRNSDLIGVSAADTCSGSQYLAFMSLLDIIIRYTCKISDPCGRITPKTEPRGEYDFVVIGAGSGGSTIAGRLAEIQQWNTLLLEAGIDEPPATQVPIFPAFFGTSIDWNFTTQQEAFACLNKNGFCAWPRGKVLGGTSVFNGMMYLRGTPADYQRWVEAGNDEWSYEDILPIFKATENNTQLGSKYSSEYHGTGGPITIQQFNSRPKLTEDILTAAKQAGYPVSDDLNGKDRVGFAIGQGYNRDGARLSLARAFVRPHRHNTNFDIMIKSTVTKILITGKGENKRATGVEFIYNEKTYRVKATKEVILAAGAVQTPQILLLSGIGSKKELQKVGIKQVHNLPAVGKGIMNHVSLRIPFSINEPDIVDINFKNINQYVTTGHGPLSGNGMVQLTARLATQFASPDDPDLQFFFNGMANTCAYSGSADSPVNPDDPTARRTINVACVNLRPKSKGYIGLLSSNPFDPPKIVANYFTNRDDLEVVLSGIRVVQKLIQAPILRDKYNATLVRREYGNCSKQYEFDSDNFWKCAIQYDTSPGTHQCSSCKMGPASNPEACVNQHLQLHGIPNLRITDASAIYTSTSANIQATIVAIAERASMFIRKQYLNS